MNGFLPMRPMSLFQPATPRGPALVLWRGIPRFLAGFEPCKDFPIIAEMATLEWAIAGALNEAEEMPAPISLIKGGGY